MKLLNKLGNILDCYFFSKKVKKLGLGYIIGVEKKKNETKKELQKRIDRKRKEIFGDKRDKNEDKNI